MTTSRFLLAAVIIIMIAVAATPGGAAGSKRSTTAGRAAANAYLPDKRVNAPLAVCTWNGSVSTDWSNGANWTGCSGGGGVPGSGDDVTIGTAPNQPILTVVTPVLSTVIINSGGSLDSSNVLSTTGNFVLGGGTPGGVLNILGGTVNVGTTTETNLLYGDDASLQIVGDAALNIGGRLSPTAPDFKLTYFQDSGTVTVAMFASTDATFGSFSIPATTSLFTMTGGSIILEQDTAIATDYVVLATSSTVSGGTVQFGDGTTGAGSKFGIQSTPPLWDLTIFNNVNVERVNLHSGDVTVNHVLTLDSGNITNIDLTGSTLIIGITGSVSRTSGWIIANEEKIFSAPDAESFTFDVGTANGYSPMDANNVTGTGVSSLAAKANQGAPPVVDATKSLQRYWTLVSTGALNTADLTFHYLDPPDVPGTSNELIYKVIRISGGTAVSFPTSIVDPVLNTGSISGVSSFSDWTLGEPSAAPTAAPARISGQVMTTDGRPLGGVVVGLNGSRSGVTITDGNGQYQFANVATDGFYTVAPALANYHFAPANRSFSLLADKADAIFSASRDAAMTANPIDTNEFFVRQQYLDFLNREPDQGGFAYWTGQLNQCVGDPVCVRARRLDVSAAFFGSEEFQETGSFVYRLYRGALGRQLSYSEFSADRKQVVGGPDLAASKAAFAVAFTARPEFALKYQGNATAESFVDALLQTTVTAAGIDLSSERSNLIAKYNSGGTLNESRSLVVGDLAENTSFSQATFNQSFVLMEYFGYLQRDIDSGGYDFWLNVLENGQPGNYRGMVCAFITSTEYQQRFSSVVTRGNGDCR
jgi:hypothetical protein